MEDCFSPNDFLAQRWIVENSWKRSKKKNTEKLKVMKIWGMKEEKEKVIEGDEKKRATEACIFIVRIAADVEPGDMNIWSSVKARYFIGKYFFFVFLADMRKSAFNFDSQTRLRFRPTEWWRSNSCWATAKSSSRPVSTAQITPTEILLR